MFIYVEVDVEVEVDLDVAGDRAPLLHRHPRPVPDHDEGVL